MDDATECNISTFLCACVFEYSTSLISDIFFFSSRRRHTRLQGDWSSDVCSSDLGELGFGVTAKDLILGTLGQLGVGGMTGHVVEYAGPAIEALSMEGRMTVCNMKIGRASCRERV